MRRLLAALLLSACGASVSQGPGSQPSPRPLLVPDAGGLAETRTGLRVDFDRAPEGVIAIAERSYGPHAALPLTGCPPGIARQLRWGEITLTFTRERFVGWKTAQAAAGQTCRE